MNSKEIALIVFSSIILGLSRTILDFRGFYIAALAFLAVILINIISKKLSAYFFELEIQIKPWEISQYWFQKKHRFKKPVSMVWLPLFLSIVTKSKFLWMPIIEFAAKPKIERIQKRHPQKFYHTTEWHLALIAFAGIIANNIFGLIFYWTGLTALAKISIYYAVWNLIPLSSLDGSKILFGSKILWAFTLLISIGFLFFAVGI